MTTITQMRDRCKQATDNVNQSFIADAEWDTYIGQSYAELYGLCVEAFGSRYFVKNPPQTVTTDGVNQLFALPSDFFKLLLVEVQVTTGNAQYVNLKAFELAEKNSIGYFNQSIPAAGQTVRVWYAPSPPVFDVGNPLPAVLSINGWDQYIVADVCIKALAKEESDVTVFMAQKNALKARLESEASNRDASNPTRILDMYGRRARSMQYALVGTSIMLVGGATPGWYYGQGDWGPYDFDVDDRFY